MKKKLIRLNELTLRKIVKESVKKVLRENDYDMEDDGPYEYLDDIVKAKFPREFAAAMKNPNFTRFYWTIEIPGKQPIISDRLFKNEDDAADDCDMNEYSKGNDCYVMALGGDCFLCKERPYNMWID